MLLWPRVILAGPRTCHHRCHRCDQSTSIVTGRTPRPRPCTGNVLSNWAQYVSDPARIQRRSRPARQPRHSTREYNSDTAILDSYPTQHQKVAPPRPLPTSHADSPTPRSHPPLPHSNRPDQTARPRCEVTAPCGACGRRAHGTVAGTSQQQARRPLFVLSFFQMRESRPGWDSGGAPTRVVGQVGGEGVGVGGWPARRWCTALVCTCPTPPSKCVAPAAAATAPARALHCRGGGARRRGEGRRRPPPPSPPPSLTPAAPPPLAQVCVSVGRRASLHVWRRWRLCLGGRPLV